MTDPHATGVRFAVTSDLLPDGSYGAVLSLGDDLSWSLTAARARHYAATLVALSLAAEHDAAVFESLNCKGLPTDLIAEVLTAARAARDPGDRWTAPLVVVPGITSREPHRPFLTAHHTYRPADGWQWTAAEARRHAAQVLQVVAAAELDSALAAVLSGFGTDPGTITAVVDHVGAHWPEADDEGPILEDGWPRLVRLDRPVQLAVSGRGIVTYDGQGIKWESR